MQDVQKVFSDFKTQVEEIADHCEQVHSLTFRAELRNGTSFNFSYNAEKFARDHGQKLPYEPVSLFNAILDIIATLSTIALLVTFLTTTQFNSTLLLATLLYSSFIVTFTLSALYHFMGRNRKAHIIFMNLKEIGKILTLALLNIMVAWMLDSISIFQIRPLTFILVAISLLFLSGRTTLSRQVSLAVAALLPLLSLLASFSLDSIIRCLLFSLWSLVPLFAKPESRMHSNSIFALIGMLSFAYELSFLLVI